MAQRWEPVVPSRSPTARTGHIMFEIPTGPHAGTYLCGGVVPDPGGGGYTVTSTSELAIGAALRAEAGHFEKWDGATWVDTGIAVPAEPRGNATPYPAGPPSLPVVVNGGYLGSAVWNPDKGHAVIHMGIVGGAESATMLVGSGYQTFASDYTPYCYAVIYFDGVTATQHLAAVPDVIVGGANNGQRFASYNNQLSYDTVNQQVILFPGTNAGYAWSAPTTDAFVLDYGTHKFVPQAVASATYQAPGASAVYLAAIAATLVYGGAAANVERWTGTPSADWILDATGGTAPPDDGASAAGSRMILNPLTGKMLVKSNSATWTYTPGPVTSAHVGSGTFAQVATDVPDPFGSGHTRRYAAMAYHTGSRSTVLFGGELVPSSGPVTVDNKTWILTDELPAGEGIGEDGEPVLVPDTLYDPVPGNVGLFGTDHRPRT